jgi:hypothetical protein
MPVPENNPVVRHPGIFLILVAVWCIISAGCMQSPGTRAPVVPVTTIAGFEQAVPPSPVPATTPPGQGGTVTYQVSPVKNVKDSELLFSLQVPADWNVTTYRISNPSDTEGLAYRTDLFRDNVFSIHTYAITRNQDQAYRDEYRKEIPAPAETTLTINGITFDRFEMRTDGNTSVAYVARKNSANERGYASVLFFTANATGGPGQADFEKVVSSFRYFPARSAGTVPGEEILRIAPPVEDGGSATSATGAAGSGSSGGGGGCGCGR